MLQEQGRVGRLWLAGGEGGSVTAAPGSLAVSAQRFSRGAENASEALAQHPERTGGPRAQGWGCKKGPAPAYLTGEGSTATTTLRGMAMLVARQLGWRRALGNELAELAG